MQGESVGACVCTDTRAPACLARRRQRRRRRSRRRPGWAPPANCPAPSTSSGSTGGWRWGCWPAPPQHWGTTKRTSGGCSGWWGGCWWRSWGWACTRPAPTRCAALARLGRAAAGAAAAGECCVRTHARTLARARSRWLGRACTVLGGRRVGAAHPECTPRPPTQPPTPPLCCTAARACSARIMATWLASAAVANHQSGSLGGRGEHGARSPPGPLHLLLLLLLPVPPCSPVHTLPALALRLAPRHSPCARTYSLAAARTCISRPCSHLLASACCCCQRRRRRGRAPPGTHTRLCYCWCWRAPPPYATLAGRMQDASRCGVHVQHGLGGGLALRYSLHAWGGVGTAGGWQQQRRRAGRGGERGAGAGATGTRK